METNKEDVVGAWGNKQMQLSALGLTLESASLVCKKLNQTGGWRMRADLATAIENARMSLSASQAYYDAKNWDMVLLELSDAAYAMKEVTKAINGEKNIHADFWNAVDKLPSI